MEVDGFFFRVWCTRYGGDGPFQKPQFSNDHNDGDLNFVKNSLTVCHLIADYSYDREVIGPAKFIEEKILDKHATKAGQKTSS